MIDPGRGFRSFALAVLIASPVCGPASAAGPATRPARDPRWAVRVDGLAGLRNFYRVSPQLYRGAQPTASGFQELSKLGIKTVVNLRASHSDEAAIRAAGVSFRYHHVSFKTWHPETEDVVEFLKVVADPSNHPVFVHCQRGADRTGLMSAVYRVVLEGWKPEEAMREMVEGGYGFNAAWVGIRKYLEGIDSGTLEREAAAGSAGR